MESYSTICFSLTRAFHTILENAGRSMNMDDLHAVLGLPFLITAADDDPDVANWAAYARDAFLIEAARDLGVLIRPVHPPEAACGLFAADEFAQHFDASYRPIIVRALENHQLVLAWRGWANESAPTWGIIRTTDSRGIGVTGTPFASSIPSPSDGVPLLRPAVQLYVIESFDLPQLSSADIMKNALARSLQASAGNLSNTFNVLVGPDACDAWSQCIRSESAAQEQAATVHASHGIMAANIAAAHESGIRFLKRLRRQTQPQQQTTIDAKIAAAERIAAALNGISTRRQSGDLTGTDLLDTIKTARLSTSVSPR